MEIVSEDGMNSGGTVKPAETDQQPIAAPEGGEPVSGDDSLDKEDISEVIEVLNEFQRILGGSGDITDVPENMKGVLRFTIEKMIAIRDLYEDPLYKKILDDLVDQKEDGKTPSVLVAVARNIPLEDLQDIADNENYEDVQGAVDQRLKGDKEAQDKEASLYAAFDESNKAGKAYCSKMGYSDEETQELFSLAMQWFKILGDGTISEDEWSKIDKIIRVGNLSLYSFTKSIKSIGPFSLTLDPCFPFFFFKVNGWLFNKIGIRN